MARGNIDTIQQTQVRELSGGEAATQFITTDDSSKTAGHLLSFNSQSNAVDAGVRAVAVGATPLLDSSTYQPILSDAGEWIFPG